MTEIKEMFFHILQVVVVLFSIAFISRIARGASIYDGAECLYVGTGQKIDDNGVFHLSTQSRTGLDCKEVKFTRSGEDFIRSYLKLHPDTEKPKGPPITLRPFPHYETAPHPSPGPLKTILGHPGSI